MQAAEETAEMSLLNHLLRVVTVANGFGTMILSASRFRLFADGGNSVSEYPFGVLLGVW